MERLFSPHTTKRITLTPGEIFRLETQRVPVVPPYLMIMPFIDYDKKSLEIIEQIKEITFCLRPYHFGCGAGPLR